MGTDHAKLFFFLDRFVSSLSLEHYSPVAADLIPVVVVFEMVVCLSLGSWLILGVEQAKKPNERRFTLFPTQTQPSGTLVGGVRRQTYLHLGSIPDPPNTMVWKQTHSLMLTLFFIGHHISLLYP